MAAQGWPYTSLTTAPTNLKEAIDWVLRVTGRDGKSNKTAASQPPASTDNPPHCLCYLAKAVKDLLYDARSPGSPGPSPGRNWNDILLTEEEYIVKPVLTDLGLLSVGSGTVSTTFTNAGGTEVIKALIDHLAQGLQMWVGWREGDTCCLKGEKGIGSKGIGKWCICSNGGGGGVVCCRKGTGASGDPCDSHECRECGINPNCNSCNAATGYKKCYQSAYKKDKALWIDIVNGTTGGSANNDPSKVHLLARIFLGSVCLIWSGLSQLGFLTGGNDRWNGNSKMSDEKDGLGSFMAAMGYDLERLNQGGDKTGSDVAGMLSKAFSYLGNGADKSSVAEYYSSIYSTAQGAAKGSARSTESICKQYPLLVLHILASGYFRAGSAGAKGIGSPAKPAPSAATKDTPVSRKPRTIREILYWLSALPYSKGYKTLVGRMKDKFFEDEQKKGQLQLHSESTNASTTLKRDDITHYLMAACGYCPLVLIGIQGTIENKVDKAQASGQGASGCNGGACTSGTHGDKCEGGKGGSGDGVCGCTSVVSCTGVLPVLYKYGFGYGDVSKLGEKKQCHDFLETLNGVLEGNHLKNGSNIGLHHEINQLIYTTRLPWIFVLTVAWLVAVLYLAFGAIWPLDWTHMRSHWLRGGEHQWQCMWYKVMTGRKGVELMEYFGRKERE